MKFNFSFQKVLDVKEKEKEQVRSEFGDLKLRQAKIEEELEGLARAKDAIFSKYDDLNRKSISEYLEMQDEINHVNGQLGKLTLSHHQIVDAAACKQQLLIEKTQETKIWNQWKEKSRLAFQAQVDKQEQTALDEMAILRHSPR